MPRIVFSLLLCSFLVLDVHALGGSGISLQQLISLISASVYLICFGCAILLFFIIRQIALSTSKESLDRESLLGNERAYYTQRARAPVWYKFFGDCVSIASFGILQPWIVIDRARYEFNRLIFSGFRTRFIGGVWEYAKSVCIINTILGFVTLGLWTCCGCAEERENKWIDSKAKVLASDGSSIEKEDTVKFYRAKQSCINWFLSKALFFCSCGLAYPCITVWEAREVIGNISILSNTAVFAGKEDKFCTDVHIPSLFLTCITCGCYSCLGFSERKERLWMDRYIQPRESYNSIQEATISVHDI